MPVGGQGKKEGKLKLRLHNQSIKVQIANEILIYDSVYNHKGQLMDS